MAKPNFILPNKPAIKAGSILSYNYTDDLKFAAEPLDFSRNSSATRVNEQGLIEEVGYFGPQLVQNGDFSQEGPELVTNGDFSSDTDWSKGTGWSIANGFASCDGTQVGNTNIYQSISFAVGKSYKVTYELSNVTFGSAKIVFGDTGGTLRSSSGIFTEYYTFVSGSNFYIQGNSTFNGSIDNVSVEEVGQNWEFNSTAILTANGMNITTSGYIRQDVVTIGKSYKLTYDIFSYTSGDIRLYDGTNQGSLPTSIGSNTFNFIAGGSNLVIQSNSVNVNLVITNISVVEIIGDKPRIDYSDSSTEPSLLLEPQSTNLLTYSEDLTQGITNRLLITSNTNSSPDGTNTADKLIPNNTNSAYHYFAFSSLTIATNNVYSVFLKKAEYEYALISFETSGSSGSSDKALINLNNGTIEQSDTETKVENYGNGWYRCSIKATSSKTSVVIYPLASASLGSFTGDNVSGILAWGLQLEQNSYATSYIPTSGSTATRLGETAKNAGGAGVFNSGEGVLYAELSGLVNGGVDRSISLSDGTTSNYLRITLHANSNRIAFFSGNGVNYNNYDFSQSSDLKMAFQYKENDWKIYINGTLKGTDTSALTFSPNTLSNLSFSLVSTSPFYGKTKNIQVFNYALTDEELQTLTT